MTDRPWSRARFREAARAIAAVSRRLYNKGWSPATSSNYSMRLNDEYCAITVSGKDKGLLQETDVMVVDMQGKAASPGRPSAETALHTQIYRRHETAHAVLHTHSLYSTVLTMHWPSERFLVLEGYEMLKALEGIQTHDVRIALPVFENTQEIAVLAEEVDRTMASTEMPPAYMIRGHGIYTWARDMDSCYRQVEALEFLFAVEVERRKIGGATS